MAIPKDIAISPPWRVIELPDMRERANLLAAELKKECPPGHILQGLPARAVATRIDRDDVLFEIEGTSQSLAVVHLTWREETDPRWPSTKVFENWEQWINEDMMPSLQDYSNSRKAK